MGTKTRDVILLLAVVALVVLAFLPGGDREGGHEKTTGDPDEADAGEDAPLVADDDRDRQAGRGTAPPLEGVPHRLMPIVAGSSWSYRVSGPPRLAPSDSWTMTIETLPEGDQPGTVAVGFGDAREARPYWLDGGAVRLDGLPLVEPLEFLGNRPAKISGSLLPPQATIVTGAVWAQEFERNVTHAITDERGKRHERKAIARQRDRAVAREIHEVDVPAGRFDARRIEWTGRVSVFFGKRPVLDGLTSEPFRSETTWFAAGIGMVRRSVSFGGSMRDSVTFNLVRYERPEAGGQPSRTGAARDGGTDGP